MSVVRAQSSVPYKTALPEDVTQNVWHFQTVGDFTLPAALDPINTALNTFYSAIDQIYPTNVDVTRTTKWYQLSDPKPRTPIRTDVQTIAPSASNPLPEECAIVLSFEGDPESGLSQKRRRGRIYIGPCSTSTVIIVNNRCRVIGTTIAEVKNAAQALLTASVASADWDWVVYSPTTAAGSTHDAGATVVDKGWVDDAWDIQRRRGTRPTVRSLFT